jgi:orotate phosphoribosyltransferase/AMMECR1 domain-containing protein
MAVAAAPPVRAPDADLDQLRELLRRDGILWSTPEQPVLHRNGATAPWMFYSWGVTLDARGLTLAARCLLERLDTFEGTQLAGHGMTAMPLVSACVALGRGRYTGLAVRKERKTYLSGRRVEGRLDPGRPVIVVDDSLSSGTALRDAIAALEAAGATVEGAVALVGFPGRGGLEAATARGYRVETLLDVTADLGMALFSLPAPIPPLPSQGGPPLPDGLAPAVLARLVAEHVLRLGRAPVPPARLDQDYDGRGGVFVSFRRRSDDHRVARDGFWHFDPADANPAADVVAATVRTVQTARGAIGLASLGALKLGVTFLGPLEPIEPRQLDFDRYAIVVRDREGTRAGGALPNTQVFTSEVEQYRHARERNAGIAPAERHRLFRQDVHKTVEPGERWPAYGAPDGPELAWARDPAVGEALVGHARGIGRPPRDDLIGSPFEGVAVTIYERGTLASALAWGRQDLAALVSEAAGRAAARVPGGLRPDLAVAVTVLHEPEHLGRCGVEYATRKVRKGLDAIRCGRATLLPAALVYNGWSKRQFVEEAARRGGPDPPEFTTYRAASWLGDGRGCRVLRSGFPAARDSGDPVAQIRALAAFTLRNQSADGVPLYHLDPVSGRRTAAGTGPRQLHALLGLHRAGILLEDRRWCAAAAAGLGRYLARHDPRPGGFAVGSGGPLADAIAFAAMARRDGAWAAYPEVRAIGERLLAMVRPAGVIAAQPVRLGAEQDLEFLPGAVLCALATNPRLLDRISEADWPKLLRTHVHRFRVLQSWGQVGWQLQGWSAVYRHRRGEDQRAFVFELADWACARQVETTGAFLEELSPDEPSFNTGFIAEGIAAAWATAVLAGDAGRAARYRSSWEAANRFMSTLLIDAGDCFCMRDARAVGGVRLTPSRVDVRADSVSHWLNGLVTGVSVLTL